SPLLRDSSAFRRTMLKDAFGTRPPSSAISSENPVAYSLWSLFPAGCSEHPALTGGTEDDSGEGGSDSGTPEAPAILRLTGFETHDTTPCGPQGMITDLDEGLGVCANYTNNQHHLFSWNPNTPGAATSIIPLSFAPDQVLRGSDDSIYVTTHQNPGLSVIHPLEGSESHHAFPASLPTSLHSSSGRPLTSITPAFPKGLVEISGQVFIATSNYDTVHEDYLPGTILAFQKATGNFVFLSSSGFNPTSVGEANGRLLVVSSGAVDRNGHATTDGFLDIFDPLSFDLLRSIPLGRRGAGVSGEITLSPDGRSALLPTADNSGRILVINLTDGNTRELAMSSAGVTGDRIFFPSLQVSSDGRFGVVGNFNDGRVYTVNLANGAATASPLTVDSNTADGDGLSDGLRIGSEFFVGVGPRLLRLQTAN
ncbi:MAG: hypothetical protein K8R69_11385, partial [Deltaproteobacteria bacterium]|nr:hypothetical protein [Deltaproteobacteria bacterium]